MSIFWKMYNYEEPNLYNTYLTKISEKINVEDLLMVVPVFLAVFANASSDAQTCRPALGSYGFTAWNVSLTPNLDKFAVGWHV